MLKWIEYSDNVLTLNCNARKILYWAIYHFNIKIVMKLTTLLLYCIFFLQIDKIRFSA